MPSFYKQKINKAKQQKDITLMGTTYIPSFICSVRAYYCRSVNTGTMTFIRRFLFWLIWNPIERSHNHKSNMGYLASDNNTILFFLLIWMFYYHIGSTRYILSRTQANVSVLITQSVEIAFFFKEQMIKYEVGFKT